MAGGTWRVGGRSGLAALCLLLVVALGVAGWRLSGRSQKHDERLVERLIERYFTSWSNQAMDEYRDCFHPSATVCFVDGRGSPHVTGLADFIESQIRAHRAAPSPMKEVPTSVDLRVIRSLAQATVRWELTKGGQRVTGTDVFTIQKSDAGWQIVSLVFANDE